MLTWGEELDRVDIHNYKRRLELTIRNVKEASTCDENKRLILKFGDHCLAEGLSLPRVEHLLRLLKVLAEMLGKSFEEADKDDIIQLFKRLRSRKLSEWTLHDYSVAIRKFFQWLRNTRSPPEVAWLRIKTPKNKMLPEELLTEAEIKRMLKFADHPRDKAFLSVLFESGCRIGEILNLRIKHVQFEQNYARLIVYGKTGKRMVPILFSAPILAEWVNNHPNRDDPESVLWPKKTKPKEAMDYAIARKLLITIARKAGIKKRVNPHTFRHSRATILAKKLPEAVLSEIFGWVQGSRMPAIYIQNM